MSCCGKSQGQLLEYVVTLKNGDVKVVGSKPEAQIVIATGGGGMYRTRPRTKK